MRDHTPAHPCAGHQCDECWVCKSGICCLSPLGQRLLRDAARNWSLVTETIREQFDLARLRAFVETQGDAVRSEDEDLVFIF